MYQTKWECWKNYLIGLEKIEMKRCIKLGGFFLYKQSRVGLVGQQNNDNKILIIKVKRLVLCLVCQFKIKKSAINVLLPFLLHFFELYHIKREINIFKKLFKVYIFQRKNPGILYSDRL